MIIFRIILDFTLGFVLNIIDGFYLSWTLRTTSWEAPTRRIRISTFESNRLVCPNIRTELISTTDIWSASDPFPESTTSPAESTRTDIWSVSTSEPTSEIELSSSSSHYFSTSTFDSFYNNNTFLVQSSHIHGHHHRPDVNNDTHRWSLSLPSSPDFIASSPYRKFVNQHQFYVISQHDILRCFVL